MPQRPETWDVVVSIVLTVLLLGATAVAVLLGLLLPLVGDSCGASVTCSTDRLTAGTALAVVGPLAVAVIAVVVLVRRLASGRRAFWVPLIGLGGSIGAWFAGAAIAVSAVPGFTV